MIWSTFHLHTYGSGHRWLYQFLLFLPCHHLLKKNQDRLLTLTLHKIWVQNAIDWVIKGRLNIFKEESVLHIRRGLENGQPFLDGLIYSERSAFGPNVSATLGLTMALVVLSGFGKLTEKSESSRRRISSSHMPGGADMQLMSGVFYLQSIVILLIPFTTSRLADASIMWRRIPFTFASSITAWIIPFVADESYQAGPVSTGLILKKPHSKTSSW